MSKDSEIAKMKAIRKAFADYVASEGCSCCRSCKRHDEAAERLAKLLRVPMFKDRSGYDFLKFKTKGTK